jgi:hypothetical protein
MRIFVLLTATFLAICPAPTVGWAQTNSCKECSDQQRRCMANYSGPTCKIEYDRCMKNCKK